MRKYRKRPPLPQTDRALKAWLAGVRFARAGIPLPLNLPDEGDGYWFRRGYTDTVDR